MGLVMNQKSLTSSKYHVWALEITNKLTIFRILTKMSANVLSLEDKKNN